MSRVKLDTSYSPIINISQIHGSLRIKGWDRPEFRGDADQNDALDVKQTEDTLDVKCSSGCMLRVPVESTLKIGNVYRELLIKSIEGDIEINEVHQQIIVKNVSNTTIGKANSNLNAKQIEGDLSIKTLLGNAVIRDVDGKFELLESNGSLNFRGLAMGITANSKGNAILRFEPEPEGKYEISSEGSINCKVSPGVGGKVAIKSGGKSIRVKTPDQSENLNMEKFNFEFGEGNSEIALNAKGNVIIAVYRPEDAFGEEYEFAFDEDFSNFADEISQQVTTQIESQMDALSTHLNEITAGLSGLSVGMTSTDRSRRKLEAQRRSLERKLARTQDKMDRKIHAMEARRRAYQQGYRGKPSDPVSDEERKMILEMLQANQITVEEAETLLSALEGEVQEHDFSVPPIPPAPSVPPVTPVEPESPSKAKPKAAPKARAKKKTAKTQTKTKATAKKKVPTKTQKSKPQQKSSSSGSKSSSKTTDTKQ